MKNIANCKPKEFFRQTVRIGKSVNRWLEETDIQNIRSRLPHKELPTMDMTTEEKVAMEERNKKAMARQIRENAMAIFESVFETHADETLEILALCCFVEPKDVDKHTISEYLRAFNELINNEDVINFFISLVHVEQILMPKA